ncbi:extracellular solute-binding protein, partial [Bacillus sp. S34]|nr:extracellular solute-binding protein [Bacillus sp. S34]
IAETGALSPLTDYGISTDGYAKGVLQAGTYKGKVYGLAPTVNTIALFYDKKKLAAAGVTPPKTWDELKTASA